MLDGALPWDGGVERLLLALSALEHYTSWSSCTDALERLELTRHRKVLGQGGEDSFADT